LDRTLTTKRLYSVSNFNNITFEDTIENLPEKIALNQEIVNKIRFLQMVEVEHNFRRYMKMFEKINTLNLEDSIKFLEEIKLSTMNDLKTLIENNN
jgi:hypothetical protein